MMKIQIELHGDKNKLGENCETQFSDQEVFFLTAFKTAHIIKCFKHIPN